MAEYWALSVHDGKGIDLNRSSLGGSVGRFKTVCPHLLGERPLQAPSSTTDWYKSYAQNHALCLHSAGI
ncbi:hypothetical protein [Variibacter gotjawalensis]|uniref:hypothetical protein n=1 Tax=Variibacter gotjawalensis TaxID=1333996 RepID=UPI00102AB5FF|nr:hypothetical protein [Variibacter gotjawalensis]NIK48194.1 hypothetical protein [Variibacter gotjawalensis]